MELDNLKNRIKAAAGNIMADLVVKNVKIVNVFSHEIEEGDLAIKDGVIVGIGTYEGREVIDGEGQYLLPGLIDSHIHIESSYVSPEEIGRLLIPHGTTTIIADPHEIVNVCGLEGLSYMLEAAEATPLDIKYMLPSCVPATDFEHSGATILSHMMEDSLADDRILGLGEFMDFPGVINAEDEVLRKILLCKKNGKLIDGHSPSLTGNALNAYVSAGIRNDHECATVDDLKERIARGMYVMLRQGSACRDLRVLLKGVDEKNARRCVLCSDDRQPSTIFTEGHVENHLKICVQEGIDPITAVQMATINAAECFGLKDRGAIAPGLRADFVLVEDLKDFHAKDVFISGVRVAEYGKSFLPANKVDISKVRGSFHVKDFSIEKLKLKSKSNFVHIITILEDGVVTRKDSMKVELTNDGDFVFDENTDLIKVAVIERHQNTGNVSVALLKGFGLKRGAIALSIAHDSHNIIVCGTNNEDMEKAVKELILQEGGMIQVYNEEVLVRLPMPIGGIMSDQTGEWVDERLTEFHQSAHKVLGVFETVDPAMTLCFMSLPVIPEIKITDMGLFDVMKFQFLPIEADESEEFLEM